MGFLADVGRSNAFQIGQGVFRDVMDVNRQEMAGNLGMLEMQERQRRTEILQAEESRRAKEDAVKQAAHERDNEILFADDIQSQSDKSGRSNIGKWIVETGKQLGLAKEYPTPDGNVKYGYRRGDLKSIMDSQSQMKEFRQQALYYDYMDKKEAVDGLQDELAKAKPDKKSGIESQLEMATRSMKSVKSAWLLSHGKDPDKEEAEQKKQDLAERRLDLAEQTATDRAEAMDKRLDILDEAARTQAKKAVADKGLSFADKEALRATGKQLPKSKIAAETAVKNVQKIDDMLALIDKGAGGVSGELLAKINKAADIFRTTSPDDAKYNELKARLRGFAGTLRLQLGLVGQTSDRDVAIMYEAAGGNSPAESQKAILGGYRQGYMQDVTNYNSDAEAYAGYSQAGGKLYRPITIPAGAGSTEPAVVETRTLTDGTTWDKFSDGTFKQRGK